MLVRLETLLCVCSSLVAVGCVSRTGFGDDTAVTETSGGDGDGDGESTDTGGTTPGDPTTTTGQTGPEPTGDPFMDFAGTYHLAIETSLGPGLPVQFVLVVDNVVPLADVVLADFSLQPLALAQGNSIATDCIDQPLLFPEVKIDANGSFDLDAGLVMISGLANPITGSDIAATLGLYGKFVTPDSMCGDVKGMLLSPIEVDLAGSRFAAVPLPAGCASMPFPPPVYSCEMLP